MGSVAELSTPILPVPLEAEEAVIGSILDDGEVLAECAAYLTPQDFGTTDYAHIYRVALEMHAAGEEVDYVTLGERVCRRDAPHPIQFTILADLVNRVLTPHAWRKHAQIVRENANRRRLLGYANEAFKAAQNGADITAAAAYLRDCCDAIASDTQTTVSRLERHDEFIGKELPAVTWACENLLATGGTTFLFSPPGLGKSVLAFELARHVAMGTSALGEYQTNPGPVIYYNLEMPAPLFQERLRRFSHHQPVGNAPLFIVNESLTLSHPAGFSTFRQECETLAPALVVVDPIIRALPGVDENSATEINEALSPACDLARKLGFALMPIHHSRKDQGAGGLDSLAGTRDFGARADVVLRLQTAGEEESPGLLKLSTVKTRWGKEAPPIHLRIEDDDHGMPCLMIAEPPNARKEVLETLGLQSPLTFTALCAELEGVKSRDQVNRALRQLVAESQIFKLKRGLYSLSQETIDD